MVGIACVLSSVCSTPLLFFLPVPITPLEPLVPLTHYILMFIPQWDNGCELHGGVGDFARTLEHAQCQCMQKTSGDSDIQPGRIRKVQTVVARIIYDLRDVPHPYNMS